MSYEFAQRKLAEHLRSELTKIRPEGKQISKFSLSHSSPGAKGNEVDTWDHDERLDMEQIEALASEIAGRAQSDADGLGPGVHRYTLVTVVGKGTRGNRFVFRLRANEDSDDEIAGEDSPTVRGLLGQLMRHNEAQARTLNASVGTMLRIMGEQLVSAHSRMAKLEEERSNTYLQLEAAKSQEHEREMDAMKTLEDEKRKGEMFKKAMDLAPVVVNRIAGKELMPAKADPLAMIIGNLADSLTEEQIQNIARTLRPEQQIMFMEAVKSAKMKNQTSEGNNGVS